MPEISDSPPVLINEYKMEFILTRWPETALGGVRLRFGEKGAPWFIYAAQFSLLLLPVALGVALMAVLDTPMAGAIYGAALAALGAAFRAAAHRVTEQSGSVVALRPANFASDAEDLEFDEFWTPEVASFLFPARPLVPLQLALCVPVGVAAEWLLHPDHGAGAPAQALGWFAVAQAVYALWGRAPADPNAWTNSNDHWRVYTRAGYVCLAAALGLPELLLALPLAWPLGLLPQLNVLLEYALEQAHVHALGGSPAASPRRLAESLAASVAALLVLTAAFASSVDSALVAAVLGGVLSVRPGLPAQAKTAPMDGPAAPPKAPGLNKLAGARAALAVAAGVAGAGLGEDMHETLALASAGAVGLMLALQQLQRPFLGNVLRHPCQSGSFAGAHAAVATVLAPAACVAYAGAVCSSTQTQEDFSLEALWFCALSLRAVRHAAAQPARFALEALVASFVLAEGGVAWLALAALAVDRAFDAGGKLWLVGASVTSVWRQKKLRFRGRPLSLLLLPVVTLPSLAVAALLAAPLLPLFGVPIFVPGFPRAQRHWSHAGASASSKDALYYVQLHPQLLRALPRLLRGGALGAVRPGDFFLFRLEKTLMWTQVLEAGAGWAVLQTHGMELQEPTSCHHKEAGHLDDLLTHALGAVAREVGSPDNPRSALNAFAGNIARPLLRTPIRSYSTSEVSLRGVLDSPDCLTLISALVPYALLWELSRLPVPEAWLAHPVPAFELKPLMGRFPASWWDFLRGGGSVAISVADYESEEEEEEEEVEEDEATDEMDEMDIDDLEAAFNAPVGDTDDVDMLLAEMGGGDDDDLDGLMASLDAPVQPKKKKPAPQKKTKTTKKTKKTKKQKQTPTQEHHDIASLTMALFAVLDVLGLGGADVVSAGPSHVHSVFSGTLPRTVEAGWVAQQDGLTELMLRAYRAAVKVALDNFLMMELEPFGDHAALREAFQELADGWFLGVRSRGWDRAVVRECPHLFTLTKKSGAKSAAGSAASVSGSSGPAEYGSELLSLQDESMYCCRLEGQAVRGMWASLGLEMLYMTNDDDERYSIQAHTTLLRNLTVQAAEPPLGYPAYSSGPTMVRW